MSRVAPLSTTLGLVIYAIGSGILTSPPASADEVIRTVKPPAPLVPKIFKPPVGAALIALTLRTCQRSAAGSRGCARSDTVSGRPRRQPVAPPGVAAAVPSAPAAPSIEATPPPTDPNGVMAPSEVEVLSRRSFSRRSIHAGHADERGRTQRGRPKQR